MKKNLVGLSEYWKTLLQNYESPVSNINEKIEGEVVTNIVVFPKHKIIYIKYAKNGGTTILKHLIKKEQHVIWYNYKNYKNEFKTWLSNITDELLNTYFIFTITRNPYDRAISACNYIYNGRCSFSTFCHSKIIDEYNQHWVPQSIICNNKNIFDYVGKMEETYDESVYFLLNKLNINTTETIPVCNKSKKNKDNNKGTENLKILNNFYKNDFVLFNYQMSYN
jgi:hypothetical protein